MTDTSLQKTDDGKVPPFMQSATEEWGRVKARVLKDTIAAECEPAEFALFVEVARAKKLDPFSRQIHPVMRWDARAGRKKMTIQTGIDGFRTLAERTGKYTGQRGPFWCGADGIWVDVWLSDDPPKAAKVEVLRADFDEPLVGVALFREYAQTTKDGSLNSMWQKFSSVMLAKCAEAIALRRAFPEILSGIYTDDEMRQADELINETAAVHRAIEATQPIHGNNTPLSDEQQNKANAEAKEEIAEAEFEEVPRGGNEASGAGATKLLLQYVAALDSCDSADDAESAITSWRSKLEKLPRGQNYIEAYEEHTFLRFDERLTIDADKLVLIDAITAMKDAAKVVGVD